MVDLRRNGGGNMWPMFAGLAPLLGERTLGAFVFPSGSEQKWFYRNGTAGLDGEYILPPPHNRLDIYTTQVPALYRFPVLNPPVAVLTGQKAASAAEAVVLAFRGRPLSRGFGAPNTGLTTAIGMVERSDGALIFLAMAVDVDRAGQQFPSGIPPDEEVRDNNITS